MSLRFRNVKRSVAQGRRQRSSQLFRLMALGAILGSTTASPTWAALFNDAATGNWNASNANTWGQGLNAFPQAGDHILKDSGGVVITVTDNVSFGDTTGVNISRWGNGGNNGSITINSGITLTHLAGSIIDQTGASMIFSGPGTFANAGTMLLDGDAGNRPINFNGDMRFENTGTITADAGKPLFNINGASVFSNAGTISQQTSGGEFIVTGPGTFINEAGGIVENSVTGTSKMVVRAARVESDGGQWNAADGRIIGIGSAGTSTIAGTFNGTNDGTGSVRLEGNITLDGTVNFNINGGLGALYRTNDGTINLGGGTLVNQGLFTIQGGSNGTKDLAGTGIFRNEGTLNHNADGMHIGVRTGQSVENNGTWTMQNKGGIDLRDAGTQFLMDNDGIFQTSAASSPVSIKGVGSIHSQGGQFNVIAGATQNLLLISGSETEGNVIAAHVGGPTFNVISGRQIELGGFWTQASGEAAGDGIVRLASAASGVTAFSAAGSSAMLNITGNGVRWYANSINFAGDELINDGKITYNSDRRAFENGLLTNNGTFEHLTTAFGGQEFEVLNATFSNNGLHDFPNNGKVEINNGIGSGIYNNNADGVIHSRNATNTDTVEFFGNGTFNNQGTVLVSARTLNFTSGLNMVQFESNPGTLTGGTWAVRDLDGAGGNTSTLAIQGVTAVTTIGAGATVELTGPNSVFAAINNVNTVQGTFLVNDRSFTVVGGNLTLDGGTVGGTGIINGNVIGTGFYSPGASAGQLTIEDNATWAGNGGYIFEIGDPTGTDPIADAGTAWDLLVVNDTLNITASAGTPFLLEISALDPAATTQAWTALIADASIITGFDAASFAFVDVNSAFNGSFSITQRNDQQRGQIFLSFAPDTGNPGGGAIPEPASAILLLGSAAAILAGRRRQARSTEDGR